MQLIQYAPATETVVKRPLLYVPPLVNKYYLLDLQPKSSLIRWLVGEGHTLFVISWVNPGPELADKGLDDYLDLGPAAALDAIEKATGEKSVDLFGFCMGGTLAAMAAARAAPGRVASLTTIGSMFDFANMGQWATFKEPKQLEAMEKHLEAQGRDGRARAAGALLGGARQRSDLVLGGQPLSARQGGAAFRHPPLVRGRRATSPRLSCIEWTKRILVDNELTRPGALAMATPALVISLKDDHVSAWQATYDGAKLLGGETRFLLGGSGHNAGVINPPARQQAWLLDQRDDAGDGGGMAGNARPAMKAAGGPNGRPG